MRVHARQAQQARKRPEKQAPGFPDIRQCDALNNQLLRAVSSGTGATSLIRETYQTIFPPERKVSMPFLQSAVPRESALVSMAYLTASSRE
jgi:hypothetical protein